MKLLRIKDNSQQKKDAFSQVAKLTGKIADKTLEQLEREGVFVISHCLVWIPERASSARAPVPIRS